MRAESAAALRQDPALEAAYLGGLEGGRVGAHVLGWLSISSCAAPASWAAKPSPPTSALPRGRIAAIAPALPSGDAREEQLNGQLVLPGWSRRISISTSRASSTAAPSPPARVKEAIAETARAKAAFTEADIEARARRTLEQAILAGTQFMRTHVEVDPRIGLQGLPRAAAAEARVRLGARPAALRLPAGGADQRSRHRGAAGGRLRAGRRPDRRLPLCRHAPRRAPRPQSSPSPGASISTSTCISTSTSTRPGCTSTRCCG